MTKKYDEDSALKGGQKKKLSDPLQKAIIDKTVEEREEDEKKDETLRIRDSRLRRLVRKAINEAEFYGETPGGQLVGTEREDARFAQSLEAEKIMKRAGLNTQEISQMWGWIKSGDPEMEFYDTPSYEKLFNLLAFDEPTMPYGVAKCRTGEPDIWILEYLAGEAPECSLPPSPYKTQPQAAK